MRTFWLGLLLFAVLILKTTVLANLTIWGIRPDVTVMVLVAVSMREGPYSGIILGFIAGLLQDVMPSTSSVLGVSALLMLGVGWIAGNIAPFVVENMLLGGATVAGLAAGFVTFFHAIFNGVLGIVSAPLNDIIWVSGMTLVLSAVFFAPVYWLVQVILGTPTSLSFSAR